jgi:hypothetical protein
VDTDGVTLGLIVTVVLLDVAVDGLAQLKLEVKIHVTTAPFVKELEE